MCTYDKILHRCGHHRRRLAGYCHFARVDDNHQCFVSPLSLSATNQDGRKPKTCAPDRSNLSLAGPFR